MQVAAEDLAAWRDTSNLAIATRAKLPAFASEDSEIVAFRSPDDMREHVALVIGNRTGERLPLVRLHSECLTGDVFGSLKCDCGPQLDAALAAMAEEAKAGGWGVLLYLGRKGAASAWSTSCAPTACRTRDSIRSKPIAGSACPRKRAISRLRRGCSTCLAFPRSG